MDLVARMKPEESDAFPHGSLSSSEAPIVGSADKAAPEAAAQSQNEQVATASADSQVRNDGVQTDRSAHRRFVHIYHIRLKVKQRTVTVP